MAELPVYNDGVLELYDIKQEKSHFPKEYIIKKDKQIPFKIISISDRLRFDLEQRDMQVTMKLRLPFTQEINSLNVVKIGGKFHKVFNAFDFEKEGIKETDLTLINYPNAEVRDNDDNEK